MSSQLWTELKLTCFVVLSYQREHKCQIWVNFLHHHAASVRSDSYCKFDKTKVSLFTNSCDFCVFTGTVIPRSLCKGVEWKYLFTFYFCVQRRNWRKVPWWTKITACTRFLTESETLTNAKLENQKRETNKFLLHVQKTSNFFFGDETQIFFLQALQFGLERLKF